MKFYKKLTHADFRELINGEEISVKLPTGDYVHFILETRLALMQLELRAAMIKANKEMHGE